MKAYTFLLNFGYAESGMLGYVPFHSNKKFSSTKEAFVDLASFFKNAFMSEPEVKLKACCEKTLDMSSKLGGEPMEYCGKCGLSLLEKEFDADAFIDFVRDIGGADADSYSGEIVPYDDEARWEPVSIEEALGDEDKSVKLIYVAEKCLAAALGHSPDDRVDIDKIFKDHRKTNSFSFWR
jgi:hypothetical protein